jgi:hypothetical protein
VKGEDASFFSFLEELRQRSIRHEVIDDPPTRISVELGEDLGQAHFLAVLLFERAIGISLVSHCVGYFNNRVLTIQSHLLTGVARKG